LLQSDAEAASIAGINGIRLHSLNILVRLAAGDAYVDIARTSRALANSMRPPVECKADCRRVGSRPLANDRPPVDEIVPASWCCPLRGREQSGSLLFAYLNTRWAVNGKVY